MSAVNLSHLPTMRSRLRDLLRPCTSSSTWSVMVGDPRLWLQMWLRTKRIETSDRIYHELKVLIDCLFYAGTFDQLNIPGLMSLEVISRRIQAISDAYTNPMRPSWENARSSLVKDLQRILSLLLSELMQSRNIVMSLSCCRRDKKSVSSEDPLLQVLKMEQLTLLMPCPQKPRSLLRKAEVRGRVMEPEDPGWSSEPRGGSTYKSFRGNLLWKGGAASSSSKGRRLFPLPKVLHVLQQNGGLVAQCQKDEVEFKG